MVERPEGRYLFVVPPLTGHVNPTVALGAELSARGHQVAWVGYGQVIGQLLDPAATLFALDDEGTGVSAAHLAERGSGLRGAAAVEFLWKDFLQPLAEAMVDGVDQAVTDFAPDVVISDQQAFAGALVARRHGLPWVTSATTSAELVDPFSVLPKIGEWVRHGLVELQIRLGVDPAVAATGDLRFSERLTIAYTTEALTGPPVLPPGSGPVLMVGPSTSSVTADQHRYRADDFPMAWLDGDQTTVLISLGTVNVEAGVRFFAAAIEAVDQLGIRAVVVASPDLLGPVPDSVLVRAHVPQLGVLERVSAVVSHGGHNTVCETLARGLPLVVAPVRDDQPVIANQVVRAGAGRRLRFGRCRAAEVAEALTAVLTDPSFRAGAERIQASFAAAGGPPAAADGLEALLS